MRDAMRPPLREVPLSDLEDFELVAACSTCGAKQKLVALDRKVVRIWKRRCHRCGIGTCDLDSRFTIALRRPIEVVTMRPSNGAEAQGG